jgi:predicted methyltransferase
MRKIALSLLLAMSFGAAMTASSQSPQSGAPAPDPAWKVPEVIAFIGLKPGDKVADIIGGRLTASLAQAVGPSGKVYAVETAEIVKDHPQIWTA